jgi:hypothetical protein
VPPNVPPGGAGSLKVGDLSEGRAAAGGMGQDSGAAAPALFGRAACDALASSLFDSVAILQSLAAQLQLLALENDVGYDLGLMLSRVARTVAARVEADAGALMDVDIDGPADAPGAVVGVRQ